MKSFKKAVALIALAAVLTGCSVFNGSAPAKDPKEALRDAFKTAYDITSGGYEATMKGKLVDTTSGSGSGSVEFDLKLGGAFSLKDVAKPLFTAKLTGSGKTPEQSGEIDAEIRLDAQNIYAILSKMTMADEADAASLAQVMGKWYKMPVPEGSFDQLKLSFGKTDEQLTPEEKQIKDLVTTTDFFKDVVFVASETVMGEKANHYTAVLDAESISAFTRKMYEIQAQPIDETQIATMKENIAKMNAEFDIWVGDDGMFRKFGVNIVASEEDKAAGNYLDNFELTFGLNKINEAVTVEAPADAVDFDPATILPVMGALQGATTETPVQ